MHDNNDIAPIEIDLGAARRGEVTEELVAHARFGIESIMKAMFEGLLCLFASREQEGSFRLC